MPKDVKRIRGSVQIFALTNSHVDEPILQIPFRATVMTGSVDYDKELTFIYIPSTTKDMKSNQCQEIKFINRFHVPIIVHNVTSDKPDLLAQYIEVNKNKKLEK